MSDGNVEHALGLGTASGYMMEYLKNNGEYVDLR